MEKKLKSVLSDSGFYAALAVCLLVVGVGGYFLLFDREPAKAVPETPPVEEEAAAPAPEVTIFTSSFFFPTTLSAFVRPASVMTAVPCWSSWKMGMSQRSFSFRSISKHRGAAMSSRLMPPKEPEIRATELTNSSTSLVFTHRGKASTSPKA